MEDDRPTAGRADQEDNEEDALPDWRQFAKFAKKSLSLDDGAVLVPFIPRRGEKDFEPLAPSSSFPASSDLATISQHQITQLHESRNALFTALSTGSRHHSSRGHNSFTWHPELARAACDRDQAFGVHFGTIGRHSFERKRLELLPEEALYLVERGAIELWTERIEIAEDIEVTTRVPMSVQQAWAEIIGTDELTVERYQVYANLRRLGFVLDRARAPKGRAKSTPAVTRRQFSTHSMIQWIAMPFIRFRELVISLARSILPRKVPEHLRLTVTRTLRRHEGHLSSLVSGRRWTTYEQIFGRLQIIPTGHDTPLPRRALPRTPSPLAPLEPIPETSPSTSLPPLSTHPYQPFFNVYKPITKYRKSDPGPPDFLLVVVNATTTSLPDLFEFAELFDQVPMSTTEDLLAPPPRVVRHNMPPPTPRTPKRSFDPAKKQEPTSWWSNWIPGWSWKSKGPTRGGKGSTSMFARKGPSPYPRLKVGRRSVLVAVVDNGTISMLRFSENEFGKLPWVGQGRSR